MFGSSGGRGPSEWGTTVLWLRQVDKPVTKAKIVVIEPLK